MSNLIILTDAENSKPVDENESLVGRVLMLNTEVAPRFQCYGFIVTRNAPIQVVEKGAMEERIREALRSKILLDVTGQNGPDFAGKVVADINKAVKKNILTTVTEGEAVGPKVIVGKDTKGNTYMVTPKDEADYERMMAELAATGTIRIPKPKPQESLFSGLTGIYSEELPLPSSSGE